MQHIEYNSRFINIPPAVFLSSEQFHTGLNGTINRGFNELLIVKHWLISLLTDFYVSNKTTIDLFNKYLYYIPLPCLEIKQ